jgi:hypothetical protein
LWAVGWTLVAYKLQRNGLPAAFFFFALAPQWLMWIGLLPFLMSAGLSPFVLLLRLDSRPLFRGLLVSALLIIQAQVHVFGAITTGFMLVLLELGERPVSWRNLLSLAVIGAPAAAFAVYLRRLSPLHDTEVVWEVDRDLGRQLVGTLAPGSPALMTALTVGLFAMAVVGWRSDRRPYAVVGMLLLLFGAFVPQQMSGWEIIGARFQPLGVALLFLALPIESSPRVRAVALLAGAVFLCFRLTWVHDYNNKLRSEAESTRQILAKIPSMDGFYWGLVETDWETLEAEHQITYLDSYLHAAQAAAVELGGIPAMSHDGDRTIHHMVRLRSWHRPRWLVAVGPPPSFSGPRRARTVQGYLGELSGLDRVVGIGAPGDVLLAEQVGYTVDVVSPGVDRVGWVGQFRGCDVDIRFEGEPDDGFLEIGFAGLNGTRDVVAYRSTDDTVSLTGMPCGPLWLRGAPGCGSEAAFGGTAVWARDGATIVCRH